MYSLLACWEINLKKVDNQQLNGAVPHILQSLVYVEGEGFLIFR